MPNNMKIKRISVTNKLSNISTHKPDAGHHGQVGEEGVVILHLTSDTLLSKL